ncbi:MAG: 2OG-Fe(II) oxygenase [Acidobacteria bacterium]|nr:2OG-Fe(II) oxygenase [Acidobacteriota bacterium]
MESVDLRVLPVNEEPLAHVVQEQFVAPALFGELRRAFPDCPPSSGPTGFSLYQQDAAYQELLASSPAWRTLYETFHSQRFIDWGIAQFAGLWERDFSRARYVPYHEDRIDKERTTLRKVEHAPDELWVRMDIHQARVGYTRGVHVDHARRLVSLLFYFVDQDEAGMEGGELVLHGPRWKRWLRRPTVVTPRENLMLAFPCSNRSWHSVPRITAMQKPRNYIQVHISSSVDVWKR